MNSVETTYIGKPEMGFAVSVRTTRRFSIQGREQVSTSETEVTELSAVNLDPRLFEVPKDFRSIPRVLPWPQPTLWARWLACAHSHWARIKAKFRRILRVNKKGEATLDASPSFRE